MGKNEDLVGRRAGSGVVDDILHHHFCVVVGSKVHHPQGELGGVLGVLIDDVEHDVPDPPLKQGQFGHILLLVCRVEHLKLRQPNMKPPIPQIPLRSRHFVHTEFIDAVGEDGQ